MSRTGGDAAHRRVAAARCARRAGGQYGEPEALGGWLVAGRKRPERFVYFGSTTTKFTLAAMGCDWPGIFAVKTRAQFHWSESQP